MILENVERTAPMSKSRLDMFLDEFSLTQSADVSRAPIPMGWRVSPASGLLPVRELVYESNPLYGHQVHVYRTLRAAERKAQKQVREMRRTLRREALNALRAQCTSYIPVVFYRKHVDWITLPVRKQEKVIIGTRVVVRKQLLRTITYRKQVVWYTKIWLTRKRGRFFGRVYKKRRHTKWVVLTKKVWRIYRQTINVRGLNKWVIVAWRRYPWVRRIPEIVRIRKVFDRSRFESLRSLAVNGPDDPRLQPLLDRLAAAHAAVVAQAARLKAYSLPDLGCRDTTTRIHIVDDPFHPVAHSAPRYTPVWRSARLWDEGTTSQFPYLRAQWVKDGVIVRANMQHVTAPPTLWFLGACSARDGQYVDYMPPPRQVQPSVVEPDRAEVALGLEERAYEACLALKSGRPAFAGFNLFRSVGELKDTDATLNTLSAARDILKGRLTAKQRALADRFRTMLLSGRFSPSNVQVIRLRRVLQSTTRKAYLASAAAVAGWYCMSKFALAPTAQDVATVYGNTFQDLVQIRRVLRNLSNLRDTLDLPGDQLILRQPFSCRAESCLVRQDIRHLGAYDVFVSPLDENDFTTGLGIYEAPNLRYSLRLSPIGAPQLGATLDKGWSNDDFSSVLHDMQLAGAVPLPEPPVSLAYDLKGLLWAPLSVNSIADLVGSESTALRRLLLGEQRSLMQLIVEALDSIHSLVGNAFTASRWLESTWELIPLSFVIDWSMTTHTAVTRVQQVLDSLFGEMDGKLGEIWCRVAMANLRATAQFPSYFLSNVSQARWELTPEEEQPSGMLFSLHRSADQPASRWTSVFRYAHTIRLTESECYGVRNYDARGAIPLTLEPGMASAIRFFRRGPYDLPPALRRAGFFLPHTRVTLSGGKILSAVAMLLSAFRRPGARR